MPDASCRQSAGRGLTLVEVIAGLALLATLLASILVAFGSQAGQIRAARDRRTAVEMADRLLGEWGSQNALPAIGTEQPFPGNDDWRWRLMDGESGKLEASGVKSVRMQVFRRDPRGSDKVLASVDLLVPGGNGTAH
jgi:type II secretory pathway pseudopilin PulG